MTINKSMRRVLKALSFDGIEVEASRHLANLKAIDPMKIFYKTIDYKIYNGDHQIPVRIFLPGEKMEDDLPALLFFHGGGWVTESIDNYERICARLASATNHIVVSVEYRLAPEYPFPTGFYDCYMAAKAMFTNRFILNTDPDKITLIGDSAGGNIASALAWRDCKKHRYISYQALLYPVVAVDREMENKFCPWSREQYHIAEGDVLITKAMAYIQHSLEDVNRLYIGNRTGMLEDVNLISSREFSKLPRTFLVTAEYDYLRIQEEYFAKLLTENGVEI